MWRVSGLERVRSIGSFLRPILEHVTLMGIYRKVRYLFEEAREKRPSIIFIDEVDAICSDRSSDTNDYRAGMKKELLVQMEGAGYDNTGVFVLAATNMPEKLDRALRSRMQRNIYIPLPNDEARKRQLQYNKIFKFSPAQLRQAVAATKGLSGRDIDKLLQQSMDMANMRVVKAEYFRRVSFPFSPKF